MDPLSLTASCIAIIGFVDQLRKGIGEIKTFIGNFSDATKRVQELVALLGKLDFVLDTVRLVLEGQDKEIKKRNDEGREFRSPVLVIGALNECSKEIGVLKDLMRGQEGRKNGSKMEKLKGRVGVAWGERELVEAEERIWKALEGLGLSLQVNSSEFQSKQSGYIIGEVKNSIEEQVQLIRDDIKNSTMTKSSNQGWKEGLFVEERRRYKEKTKGIRISRYQEQRFTQYKTLFGVFSYRQRTAYVGLDKDERETTGSNLEEIEKTWSFVPNFLSTCVEIHRRYVFGSVSSEIRFMSVVPDTHPLFVSTDQKDLDGFKACLSKGGISPFVVTEYGYSLLRLAVARRSYELCDVLLKLGVGKYEVYDEDGATSLWTIHDQTVSEWLDPNGILELFARRDIDIVEREPDLFFGNWRSLEEYKALVGKWVTPETVNIFSPGSPLVCGFKSMMRSPTEQYPEWASLMRNIIKMGADVHRFNELTGTSLLDQLLQLALEPFHSQWLGRIWLSILNFPDIDTEAYITAEYMFHYSNGTTQYFLQEADERKRLLMFSDDPFSNAPFWWEWYYDPGCSGYDVLEEFKNVTSCADHRFTLVECSGRGKQDGGESCHWPFVFNHWWMCWRRVNVWQSHSQSSLDVVRLKEGRFERRCMRKEMKKIGKKAFARRAIIPGAWVD